MQLTYRGNPHPQSSETMLATPARIYRGVAYHARPNLNYSQPVVLAYRGVQHIELV